MDVFLDKKLEIKNNFSESVSYYDRNAAIQKQAAERMAKALEPWQRSIPDGPILEIGAGTGFFTQYLIDMYPDRNLLISDLSDEMVRFCSKKFSSPDSVEFTVLDAEKDDLQEKKYALITGSYVAQWFKYPSKSLSKIASYLKPGGLMLISFPAKESFTNWKQYCHDLGIPYTGNSLPDLEQVVIELSMGPAKVDYYEDDMIDAFENVFEFFRHLKYTGTSTNLADKQLSIKQLKLLNDYWLKQDGGKIRVQYHTAFIAVKRNLES